MDLSPPDPGALPVFGIPLLAIAFVLTRLLRESEMSGQAPAPLGSRERRAHVAMH